MSNTYQYQPPNGTEGPITPINGHTLQAGSGMWFVHSSGIYIAATENNDISFQPVSNFNVTNQPYGGEVDMAGSWNTAIANWGGFVANDSRADDAHNTFIVGKDVPQLTATLQPTDQVLLQDVTRADLAAAFKSAQPDGSGGELVSVNRAGASPLSIDLAGSHSVSAALAQFHSFG